MPVECYRKTKPLSENLAGLIVIEQLINEKKKLFTKKGERLKQASLIHNSELSVPLLAAPLNPLDNSKI